MFLKDHFENKMFLKLTLLCLQAEHDSWTAALRSALQNDRCIFFVNFLRFLAIFFVFWPFSVTFLTCLQAERDSWTAALRSASHRHMRSHLEELRSRLRAKMDSNPNMASEAAEDAEAFLPPVIGEYYCKDPNN